MNEPKPTTDRTNTARQSRRRQRLDQAAQRYGFDTWTKFETWVISNEIDWYAAVDELMKPEK